MLDLDKTTWNRVKFSDVVKNINDYYVPETDGVLPYVAGPHIDPNAMQISMYGLTSDENFPPTFKRKFQPGDVLLHTRGIEKIAAVDRAGVTGEKLFVLRTFDAENLDQRFLPVLLRSPSAAQFLDNHFTGSVNRFLNWRPLASWEFDLPPMDEQKRIADLLWAVERHERALANSTHAAYRCRTSLVEYRLPVLDESLPLSNAAQVTSGITLGPKRREIETTAPYLRVANVHRGSLNLSEVKDVGATPSEIESKGIRRGDVLVVEGHASVSEIGRAAIWERDDSPLFQNHIFRVRAHDGFRPRFLLEWINSSSGRAYIRTVAKSTSGLNTINSTVLKEMPVPNVLHEHQDALLEDLDVIDLYLESLNHEKTALARLRFSFLSTIFGDN